MMFAAGALGASWLWVLALVVARYYGTWRRWYGWTEIKRDMSSIFASGTSTGTSGTQLGIGLMLGWSAALGAFVLHAQLS